MATRDLGYLRREPLIVFEGLGSLSSKWSYRRCGKDFPKRGEYYLSGAIPQAYKAPNDLTTKYEIVQPIQEHKQQTVWLPIWAT